MPFKSAAQRRAAFARIAEMNRLRKKYKAKKTELVLFHHAPSSLVDGILKEGLKPIGASRELRRKGYVFLSPSEKTYLN